jgi:hypothetical protein
MPPVLAALQWSLGGVSFETLSADVLLPTDEVGDELDEPGASLGNLGDPGKLCPAKPFQEPEAIREEQEASRRAGWSDGSGRRAGRSRLIYRTRSEESTMSDCTQMPKAAADLHNRTIMSTGFFTSAEADRG